MNVVCCVLLVQHFFVKSVFSYWLLSFACFFQRFFAHFVRGFVVFPRLSFYRCLAVVGFAFVVCGGFCALAGFWRRFSFFNIYALNWCFSCYFPTFVWFSTFFYAWFRFLCRCFSHCLVIFVWFSIVVLFSVAAFVFSVLNQCFSHCLLDVLVVLPTFSSFLPCLSKTKLTGGLARAGAARRRWKSGLWAFCVFLAVELAVGGLMVFFLSCRPLF